MSAGLPLLFALAAGNCLDYTAVIMDMKGGANSVARSAMERDLTYATEQVWHYRDADDPRRERIWRRYVTELRAKLRAP